MSTRAKLLALLLPAIIFIPGKTLAASARFITVVPGQSVNAEPLPDAKPFKQTAPQDNSDIKPATGQLVAAVQTAPASAVAKPSSEETPASTSPIAAVDQTVPAPSPSAKAEPAQAAPSANAKPAPASPSTADASAGNGDTTDGTTAVAVPDPGAPSSFIKDDTVTVVSPPGVQASDAAGQPAAGLPAAAQPALAGIGLDAAAGTGLPTSGLLAPIARNIKYFSVTVRKHFQQWLSRSGRYMGLMKSILRENYMPEDLVFLALIESGFNPKAYSWAKACGPWQFIRGTAVRYGLRVDSWVDERRDPIKSTKAAAAYLKDLYGTFGSWPLAMASYNAGEGNVERAIDRTGGIQDFWKLRKTRYIPSETKDYVPKFIAARMIAENPDGFGFKDLSYDKPFVFDEVVLNHCTDLRTVALCCGVSIEKIKELNPELIRNCTPPGRTYTLRIPKGKKDEFLAAYDSLPKSERYASPKVRIINSRYIVRRRATLKAIAARLGVPAAKLARANHLRVYSRVGRGRRLIVPREKLFIAAEIPTHPIKLSKTAASPPAETASSTAGESSPDTNPVPLAAQPAASAQNLSDGPEAPVLRLGSLLPSPTAADADESGQPVSDQPAAGQKVAYHPVDIATGPHHPIPHYRPRHRPARSRSVGPVTYRVRKGDTLSSIARKHGTTIAKLARLNRLGRHRIIKAGQKLKLQPVYRLSASRTRTAKISKGHSRHSRIARLKKHSLHKNIASRGKHSRHGRAAHSRRYQVKSGDTLWSIARKFGVSQGKISRVNSMRGHHSIRKGQMLIIPAA
ncbi:MAG: LysM peptidoglycan-binding domain-containing protein [Nitrospirota bacterium]